MKKYSLIAAMALSFAACQNKTESGADTKTAEAATTTAETATPAAPATATTVSATKIVDPVCGMPMENEKYTEFVANGTDTTWFCSPHCKDQYVKNPEKYKHPEAPKS